MDGIYYNQEVTAEMLNAIATDLGATSFNSFGTEKFGANELNSITAALVGRGVLTTGNMCRVISSDGAYYVQDGTIVFANGAKKTISEAVEVTMDGACVIYALNNITAGTCTIETAEVFPADGSDFVRLAELDANGTLTDRRDIAQGKTASVEGAYSEEFNLTYSRSYRAVSDENFTGDYAVSFQPANPKCTYLLITGLTVGDRSTTYEIGNVAKQYVKLSDEADCIILSFGGVNNRLYFRRSGNGIQSYWHYNSAASSMYGTISLIAI